MLRNLLTAAATDRLARHLGGAQSGRAGALIGFALPFVARRAGPAGIIGAAVGAWAIGKLLKSQAAKRDTNATPESTPDSPVSPSVDAG